MSAHMCNIIIQLHLFLYRWQPQSCGRSVLSFCFCQGGLGHAGQILNRLDTDSVMGTSFVISLNHTTSMYNSPANGSRGSWVPQVQGSWVGDDVERPIMRHLGLVEREEPCWNTYHLEPSVEYSCHAGQFSVVALQQSASNPEW